LLKKQNIRNSLFIAAGEHLRGFDNHTSPVRRHDA
jgi:hypothetical protein